MPTLLVIDVQPSFASSLEVLSATVALITYARKEHWGIVVLEYQGHGDSCEAVLEAVQNYSKAHIIKKHDDDGSIEFVTVAFENRLPLDEIYVAGVNRGFCVLSTVQSLAKMKLKPKVLKDATWSNHSPKQELEELRSLDGVEVLDDFKTEDFSLRSHCRT